MAGNLGELVQMITALSGVQAQKRQLDEHQQEIENQATQFAQIGEENKFAAALKLIAGSSTKTRQGLGDLVNSLAPQHQAAARAFLNNQPIDPSVIHGQDIQTGHDAMNPNQLAAVQNEAATQNATGLNVGQLGASQLGGVLATGAIPQVTPGMAGAFAERAASGRTPVQAAVEQAQASGGMVPTMARIAGGLQQSAGQAAQTSVGMANVNLGYANLDHEERKMAAYYGLDKMLKEAEAAHYLTGGKGAGLTGQAWIEAMEKSTSILNDINNPKSDKVGNMARVKVYNTLMQQLGTPELQLPISGEGAPSKVGFIQQMMNGVMGNKVPGGGAAGGATMAWPSMTPATLETPR